MQTFLPYADLRKSAQVLDSRRLGKQRVECVQLLNALRGKSKGWTNHPAARMWRGYHLGLELYMTYCIQEWKSRGYRNSMPEVWVPDSAPLPPWFGDEAFHRSHQSNLVRKDPAYYGPLFPGVPDNLPYIWPQGCL